MRVVSKKVYGIIYGLSVSVVMSLSMSCVMLLMNVGYVDNFFMVWMKSAVVGLMIAFPIASISIPLIQKFLNKHMTVEE